MRRDVLGLLFVLVIAAPLLWFEGVAGGEAPSGCASCHDPIRTSAGHSPFAGQCQVCHLGDAQATEAEAAHVGLEREPGALDTAARTCGVCHPAEMQTVSGSLMHTARGLVSVDAWAFGEQDSPDGGPSLQEILAKPAPSPSQDHVRRLCAGCHLGARADNRDDVVVGIGSGCSACHAATGGGEHPITQLVPSTTQCFGCHSRSGRIALSYQGQAEVDGCVDGDTLADGRVLCQRPADVHARAGLDCVDCHLHTELMGDGGDYLHEEQAVELRCESCHTPTAQPWSETRDPVSRILLRLHGEARPDEERVPVGIRGTPLWNLRPSGEGWTLFTKAAGEAHPVPATPQDAAHALRGHERLSCAACHSPWAPSCTTCHTAFDANGVQWDFGQGALRPGAWVERSEGVGTAPPVLAVRGERVVPAIPGMIAEIALPSGERRLLRRFSAMDPHTTGPARSCASCHADPWALGLGAGTVRLQGEEAVFRPEHPEAEGLAMDRWVAPDEEVGQGTRTEVRSLDRQERLRMLRVATCVHCHNRAEDPVWSLPEPLEVPRAPQCSAGDGS